MGKLLSKLGITTSKGVFRTIAAVLTVASQLPPLAAYSTILVELAAIIGGLGLAKAGVSKFSA